MENSPCIVEATDVSESNFFEMFYFMASIMFVWFCGVEENIESPSRKAGGSNTSVYGFITEIFLKLLMLEILTMRYIQRQVHQEYQFLHCHRIFIGFRDNALLIKDTGCLLILRKTGRDFTKTHQAS
jgi:hypothetical protein